MSTAPKHAFTRPAGLATLDDLLAIPEPQRFHELIEGVLVEKEAASAKHGEAQLSLGILLRPFRRGGAGGPGGWVFASEVEVWFSEHTTLRPDVAGLIGLGS